LHTGQALLQLRQGFQLAHLGGVGLFGQLDVLVGLLKILTQQVVVRDYIPIARVFRSIDLLKCLGGEHVQRSLVLREQRAVGEIAQQHMLEDV